MPLDQLLSESSGTIARLFEKIRRVDEQIERYDVPGDEGRQWMKSQFLHQKTELVRELNEYLHNQKFSLEVRMAD
jgi:uncharacterized protein YdcH (DUF465 family)